MKKYALLLAIIPATASASGFSYKNFNIGYLDGSAELPGYVAAFLGSGRDLDLEGFQVDAQYDFMNNFFGFVSYQDGEIKTDVAGSYDKRAFALGMGGSLSFFEQADLQYSVGYRFSDWSIGGGNDQEIGHIIANVGIRWSPIQWLEISPSITHYIPANDDNLLKAGQATYVDAKIIFTLSDMFQPFIGATYNLQEDSDNVLGDMELFQAGLRISF